MLVPLQGQPTILQNSTPALGFINTYNTGQTGSVTIGLPQVVVQTAGAMMLLEKDINDTTANTVTFTCYQGDKFADGSTSLVLTNPGQQSTVEVINISGLLQWKVIGGLTVSTVTNPIENDSDEDDEQFGENPDDVSPTIVIDGQEISDPTRFGEHLPTGTGYGGYGDGLYGYGY
jgi:hypothetical protein